MLLHPAIDGTISPNRAGEPQELAHIESAAEPHACRQPPDATNRGNVTHCQLSSSEMLMAFCSRPHLELPEVFEHVVVGLECIRTEVDEVVLLHANAERSEPVAIEKVEASIWIRRCGPTVGAADEAAPLWTYRDTCVRQSLLRRRRFGPVANGNPGDVSTQEAILQNNELAADQKGVATASPRNVQHGLLAAELEGRHKEHEDLLSPAHLTRPPSAEH